MPIDLLVDTLLPRLLAASVQAALLAVLVWSLCRVLPRLSAATRCWLWWLVALQLLVGVVWTSPMSLPVLPADPLPAAVAAPAMQPVLLTAADMSASSPPSTHAAPRIAVTWPLALAALWLAGVLLMLARTLRGWRATRRLVRSAVPCGDPGLLQALALAADAHGLRAPPRLRLSAAITSPQLVGPWKPVLLLPAGHADALQPDELDMALTHELVHLQRRDLWWGLVPTLAQHLFFFHPAAHLAAREYGLAREAACDASVLAGSPQRTRAYGQLLLRLGVAPRPCAGLASASPDFILLKRRLTMLQTASPLPRVVAVVLTVAIGAIGVTPYRLTAATPPPAPERPAVPAVPALPAAPASPVGSTAEPLPAPSAEARRGVVAARSIEASMPPPPAPPAPAPASPPAAPAPPAAPEPLTGALRGTFTLHSDPGERAFVLLDGDDNIAIGTPTDLRDARAARRGDTPLVWLRRGEARYVVRDRATIQAIRDAYAEVGALGAAQGELGARQGELGSRQGDLGSRQAELAMTMAARSMDAARLRADARRDLDLDALRSQQDRLQADMQRLATQQAGMAREQAGLAARQQDAARRAERDATRIIDAAIRTGSVERL